MLFESSSAIAILDPERGETLTYNDLRLRVDELAKVLTLPSKGLIFLLSDNSVRSIIAYLASLESNNAVALLDSQLHKDKLDGFVSSYHPDLIVDSTGKFQSAEYSQDSSATGLSVLRTQHNSAAITGAVKLLLPTSGSTGGGKMVRLSAESVKANALSIAQALAITSSDRAVLSLPIHYSYGLSVLNSHLVSGASVVVTRHMLTSKEFWNHVQESRSTSFAGVPYSYEILQRLNIDSLNVPHLKTMTQAGGKLGTNQIEHFHKVMADRGGRFFTMYGQTEATARISILPANCLPAKIGSVGKAIPGGSIEIVKQNVDDAVGEIVYRGPNVMLGYATNREDLNLGDVNQGVLHTGDLGYLDSDGLLYVTGRTQRFGKIFGIRLNLDEIEALLSMEGTLAVVSDDRRLLIYCEGDSYSRLHSKKVELAQNLGIHHSAVCPRPIESLPRMSNGKIDYMKLMTGASD